jgi:hypothetical protein
MTEYPDDVAWMIAVMLSAAIIARAIGACMTDEGIPLPKQYNKEEKEKARKRLIELRDQEADKNPQRI